MLLRESSESLFCDFFFFFFARLSLLSLSDECESESCLDFFSWRFHQLFFFLPDFFWSSLSLKSDPVERSSAESLEDFGDACLWVFFLLASFLHFLAVTECSYKSKGIKMSWHNIQSQTQSLLNWTSSSLNFSEVVESKNPTVFLFSSVNTSTTCPGGLLGVHLDVKNNFLACKSNVHYNVVLFQI